MCACTYRRWGPGRGPPLPAPKGLTTVSKEWRGWVRTQLSDSTPPLNHNTTHLSTGLFSVDYYTWLDDTLFWNVTNLFISEMGL